MTTGVALDAARAGYGAVDVLHDVSMTFPPGVTALLGRNGAGKTTTLSVLAGTVPLRSGRVRFAGHDISRWSTHRRRRAGITLVPDEPNVFATLTVADNLTLFAEGGPTDGAYVTFPELRGLGDRRAGRLSGGERQMLALSRVLVRPTPVILLDEVSRGLAPAAVQRLYAALASMRSPERIIVVVDQYRDELLGLADIVYVLRRGELAWAGEPAELRGRPLHAR